MSLKGKPGILDIRTVGMVAAFEFFGCVPKEVWWDNPKTVATAILQGRQRQLHPRYAALASHYAFEPLFCRPARGNEKPDAESTVKAVQRRFATPVPRVADLAELNASFHSRCRAERERIVHSLSGPFKIGDRFADEQALASLRAGVRKMRGLKSDHPFSWVFQANIHWRPLLPVYVYQQAAQADDPAPRLVGDDPGFVPDPNYTWVPRSRVQEPPTTVTVTQTPPTTPTPTTTTTPPFNLPTIVLPPPFGPPVTTTLPPPGPAPAPPAAPPLPGLP